MRGYRLELFREDLKKLYEQTGINQTTTVFLFNDTQVRVRVRVRVRRHPG